jgi:phosphatidylglycerophosphatase A
MKDKIIKAIVTGFYIGCLPVMPGTFGSLLAFPISLSLFWLCSFFKVKINISALSTIQQELLGILTIFILACGLIFVIGKYLVDIYIKNVGKEDPKEVVIDEIAGQMLTSILTIPCCFFAYVSPLNESLSIGQIDFIFIFLIPFTLFRIFDGLKPWPINWLDENIHGGFGVMIDDFAAAIFASIMTYAVTFLLVGVVGGA